MSNFGTARVIILLDFKNKKIVVTCLMHLGDIVLTTPFLHVLRANAAGAHITYLVDEKLADVVRYNPNIDSVVTIDKKGRDNSIGAVWQRGRRINKEQSPDILINLHPNERCSLIAVAAGAKRLAGMNHFLLRTFMTDYARLDRRRHAADMYVNILEQLGVENIAHNGLELYTCTDWEEKVADFYKAAGVGADDRLLGFNIGSAVPEKRWPPERFAAVADHFAAQGYRAMFFGGVMDKEMVNAAVGQMKSTPIIGTGCFGIGELAAAIRRCSALITNDSGPMHVGVSQKVPIVAMYGPSNPAYYGPYTDKAIVIPSLTDFNDDKSMKKIIRSGKYKGMSVIKTEQVVEATEEMVKR